MKVSADETKMVRLMDQMILTGRHKLDVERQRRVQEEEVANIRNKLQLLRNKVDRIRAEMGRRGEEVERMKREYSNKMEEAEMFDRSG